MRIVGADQARLRCLGVNFSSCGEEYRSFALRASSVFIWIGFSSSVPWFTYMNHSLNSLKGVI